MGVGNYQLSNAKTIYIDNESVYGRWDDQSLQFEFIESEIDFQFCFDDLIERITDVLPNSYSSHHQFTFDRIIIAENSFYRVSIVEWQQYFALNIELNISDDQNTERCSALAKYHHDRSAKRIFDALYHDGLILRQRICGWTSEKYHPTTKLVSP